MPIFKEFKEFAVKGNVVDLAVGIVIGGAFGKIVSSFVSDILMPPIGLALGKLDFSNMFLNLSSKPTPETLAQAKAAGIPTVNYGIFLSSIIDFTIVAFAVFLLVKQINRMKREAPAPAATTKSCPFCISAIPIKAVRCPQCTSEIRS